MSDRGEKDFFELLDALKECPKLPSGYILSQLGSYASSVGDWERGKVIQRELPAGRIAYSWECEAGAGFWDRITNGAWRSVPLSDGPTPPQAESPNTPKDQA